MQADPKSPSEQAIFTTPIEAIGLPGPKSYQDMKIVTDYRTATKKTLKHFFEAEVNTTNVLHAHPGRRAKLTSILDLAQGVVDFEVKLAAITPSKEEQWDMTKSYNKINASAFETMLTQISLSRFTKALAPSYKADSVIVTSPKYLSKLQSLLEITTKEILSGFLVWKAVQRYADRIDDPALRPLRTFNAKLKGSRQDQPAEQWRRCINEADHDMSWITAWFFLQGTKLDLKKANASDITNTVADALSKQVKDTKWLADADAQASAEKLQAVGHNVGSHPPTESEVAKSLKMSLADYQDMLSDGGGHQLVYYEDFHADEGSDSFLDRYAVDDDDPLRGLMDTGFRQAVIDAINALPPREKILMGLYYEEEMNLKEIGAVMGVSESRVSQLHTQAVARLRATLREQAWTGPA